MCFRFLKDEEWDLCAELTETLKPFAIATRKLSGEKHVTASAVLTMWRRASQTLQQRKEKNVFQQSDDVVSILLQVHLPLPPSLSRSTPTLTLTRP